MKSSIFKKLISTVLIFCFVFEMNYTQIRTVFAVSNADNDSNVSDVNEPDTD